MEFDTQLDSTSWRLEEDVAQLLSIALYVRAAADLVVPPAADVPPTLTLEASQSRPLVRRERVAAGEQWLIWWRQLLVLEMRGRHRPAGGDPEPLRAWMRARTAELNRLVGPPDFAGLADRPALRRTVAATFEAAQGWCNGGRPDDVPLGRPRFDWTLVKDVAEKVAFDRRVAINAMNGVVVLVPIEGLWWYRAPAGVVCSLAAPDDPSTATAVLYNAFLAGLTLSHPDRP